MYQAKLGRGNLHRGLVLLRSMNSPHSIQESLWREGLLGPLDADLVQMQFMIWGTETSPCQGSTFQAPGQGCGPQECFLGQLPSPAVTLPPLVGTALLPRWVLRRVRLGLQFTR